MNKQFMLTRLTVMMLWMILTSPAHSAILNVPSEFSTIQSAIDAAFAGDEIIVQPGIYFERLNYLGKDIAVRSSSGPLVTIIDPLSDPGPVVTIENGETELAILEGFTIRNGRNVFESTSPPGLGGGIFIFGSSPRILNCVITANEANHGGGMLIDGTASPLLEDCVFSANQALSPDITSGKGAGVYVTGLGSGIFRRCVFTDNTAESEGGGISTNSTSASQIIDCEFANNLALTGGGIQIINSNSIISDSSFLNNTGRVWGGAIFSLSNISILNCMFVNNSAAMDGGAVYTSSSQGPSIEDSTFLSNNAEATGGAIRSSSGSPVISNCFFGNNSSGNGGALYENDSSSIVTTSFFSCNIATINGAAYELSGGSGQFTGCTFRDNHFPFGGGSVLFSGNGAEITVETSELCGLPTLELIAGTWIDNGGNSFSEDCSPTLRADIDCNGSVNVSDLLLLLGAWGPCSQCPSDLNLDDAVNITDLLILLVNWGNTV